MSYDEPTLPITPGPYAPGVQAPPVYDRQPTGSEGTDPESGLTGPETPPQWHPGKAADAGYYDRPGGSHGTEPENDQEVLDSQPEPCATLEQDPMDPQYGLLYGTGPLPGTPGIAGLSAQCFDVESGDYIVVPVED